MLKLRKIQVFEDSRVVVDLVNDFHSSGKEPPTSFVPRSFLYDKLEWFSCSHILRELSEKAYGISKEALQLEDRAFIVKEYFDNQFIEETNFLL
jgi:hypothetical protein